MRRDRGHDLRSRVFHKYEIGHGPEPSLHIAANALVDPGLAGEIPGQHGAVTPEGNCISIVLRTWIPDSIPPLQYALFRSCAWKVVEKP